MPSRPAVAGVLWLFMFNTRVGVVSWYLGQLGYDWNHVLNDGEAMGLVVVASAWGRISYNFLFFLAGLQAIPRSVIEAAAIDGARFWTAVPHHRAAAALADHLLPAGGQRGLRLLRDLRRDPHHHLGGPQQATTILVYKVYSDGFVGQDLGSSAAQSVILLVVVVGADGAPVQISSKSGCITDGAEIHGMVEKRGAGLWLTHVG
jgi:sn-glycerol 3-phosphate transport system permease protein